MKCIFCHKISLQSKSIEHIIPESLCEQHWTLPKGIVCDDCNNYFSRKVEKIVLESDEFKYLRFHQRIKTKKGKFTTVKAYISNYQVDICEDKGDYRFNVYVNDSKLVNDLFNKKADRILVPQTGCPPDQQSLSRFIAKMAVEYLAYRVKEIENWNEDFINNLELQRIVQYARYPKKNEIWEITKRRVYDENTFFINEGKNLQILNEMDLVVTNYEIQDDTTYSMEIFFVIIIFGIEYAINLAGNDMSAYKKYLKENNFISPLYLGKNSKNTENNGLINTPID